MTPEGADTDDILWNTAARHADETLTQGESREGLYWRRSDPRHEAAYQRLLRIAQDRALHDALAKFDMAPAGTRISRRALWRRPVVWGGAGLALAACLSLFLLPPFVADWTTPLSIYSTKPGEVRELTLADGSHVTLNGGSRLETRLTGYRRNVALKSGEAYFDVAHDASRPFYVGLAGGKVRVLGTEFNLSYLPNGVELDVYEGKVRLTGDARRAGDFTRGMRASLESGHVKPLSRFDPQGDDWRRGWIEPDHWPLERVVQALSRQSGLTIRFADNALKQKPIVGRIRLDAPEAQLEALALVHGFTVERQGEVITLR